MRCSSDHFRHPAAIRVDSEARHGKMNTGCNSLQVLSDIHISKILVPALLCFRPAHLQYTLNVLILLKLTKSAETRIKSHARR